MQRRARKPRKPLSEKAEQVLVVEWFYMQYPKHKIYHITNEGKRSVQAGALWKRAGGLAGLPDLHVPIPRGHYPSMYVELKRIDRINEPFGGLSEAQLRIIAYLREQGHCVAVCHGAEQAIVAINTYMRLPAW